MRVLPALLSLLSLSAVACGPAPGPRGDAPIDEPEPVFPTESDPPPAKPPVTVAAPQPAEDPPYAEIVNLEMLDKKGDYWICTATLISSRTLLTAAHCLDPSMFVGYFVDAANAPDAPQVAAGDPQIYGGSFEDVANPDIGILTLLQPIELHHYGVPTDVAAMLDAGEEVTGAAILRTREADPTSPFEPTSFMPISSAVDLGYEHGISAPMFSQGGDSGAALFRVEDGEITHEIIGVVRQPDPARGLDQLTRIDAGFLTWLADHAADQG